MGFRGPKALLNFHGCRLDVKWIGTVLDRRAETVNCISEGVADRNGQYMEKLNRLTAESWRKRGL